MFWKMLLIFTLIPLLELALLIYVGQIIGVMPTVLLVFITGVVGATLARAQGLMVIRDFQLTVQRARVPAMSLMEGLLLLIGAAFLVTPGLITDVLGFLLILPATRKVIAVYGAEYVTFLVKKKVHEQRASDHIHVDIEWEEDEP